VIDGSSSLPSYASVTPSGQSDYVWASNTTDPRALQTSGGSSRIAATWYSAKSFTVDVNLTDGQEHPVALYLLDWDGGGRQEQVEVLDAVSGKVLDSETATGFQGGRYLVWDLAGRVLVRVTRQSGPNAVLSGLFFDPAAPA
jgi:hypothetical protein